jgi:hypothetical protein
MILTPESGSRRVKASPRRLKPRLQQRLHQIGNERMMERIAHRKGCKQRAWRVANVYCKMGAFNGAVHFLTKPVGEDALMNAIRQALEYDRTLLGTLSKPHERGMRKALPSRRFYL